MTLDEYNHLEGDISLEDAIDVMRQLEVGYDRTISYKAERRILQAACDGELVPKK